MDSLFSLMSALHACPEDDTGWLALADCLEEQGEPDRAELTRLTVCLRRPLKRGTRRVPLEDRLRELLAGGVLPCVPEVVNSLGMRFALVPPGTFRMGSIQRETGAYADEHPRRLVRITRPFYLGVFAVTQTEYQAVIGYNPSQFQPVRAFAGRIEGVDPGTLPVDSVTWTEASIFCRKLSALPEEKEAGRVYRLPTEAEWEYACRAGTTTPFHQGRSVTSDMVNFDGLYPYNAPKGPFLERPAPVGSYPPSAFGLYEMHGNINQWCADWFEADYYDGGPEEDPAGPENGSGRCYRGGCWNFYGKNCRAAYRGSAPSGHREPYNGFRVALTFPLGR